MTVYLVIEKIGRMLKPRAGRFFNSTEEAWEWVDSHHSSPRKRLNFYCVPINFPYTEET